MGFIRDNTNSFEVYLTDLGKQKFFEDGFKDSISYFSISDTDSNYTIFNPALNEIIPFEKMSEINIGDVVSYITINSVNDNNGIDGTIDNTFNIGDGFNDIVRTIELQPDGNILVGGDFTTYSGVTRNKIIRLTSGGTIDNTFNIGDGFSSVVLSIIIQPDGKILAGGNFTSYSGVTSNKIIRLTSGGTIDNTFNSGNGFSNDVNTIALQPDGKILAGGNFTSYSGVTSNKIIRLNTGGTVDNTFNIGTGFIGDIYTIALQPDGNILVGGDFTTYSGVTRNKIIRLTSGGTIDNTFNIGTGFTGTVNTIALQPDGKILVGGTFTTYNDFPCNNIIRLNTDGTIDNTFNIGSGFSGGSVLTIVLQPDGKILVGGEFTIYNSVFKNKTIRLRPNGDIDNSFNIGTGFTASSAVRVLQPQPNGKILIGGNFTTYSGITSNSIIRLNTDFFYVVKYFRKIKEFNNYDEVPYFNTTSTINNEYWEEIFPFDSVNINPQPIQILNHNNTKKTSLPLSNINLNQTNVYFKHDQDTNFSITSGSNIIYEASNPFISILDYKKINNVFNINETITINSCTSSVFDIKDVVIKIYLDSGLLVDTIKTNNNCITLNKTLLNGNSYYISASKILFNDGFNSTVSTIELQPDGNMLIGGNFTSYNGVTRNNIIRLTSGGTIDNTFNIGSGFNDTINTITLQPDGKILVGGFFTSYSGVTSNCIIRLNTGGTIDNTFNIGSGFNTFAFINTIALQPDGNILAGGDFTTYSGITRNNIIRLTSGGTVDNTFNIGSGFNGAVSSITLQPDGNILVGGNFTSYDSTPSNRIIRLTSGGTVDNTFNIGTGFTGDVYTITLQPDGKILVGGSLTSYSGVTIDNIIRLTSGGTIDNTFNIGSGFNDTINTITLQPDGKILVGGFFTSYDSNLSNRIIRLTTGGTIDNTFNIGSGFNAPGFVYPIALQPDGKILAGGIFTSYQLASINNIIRLTTDGAIDDIFNVIDNNNDGINLPVDTSQINVINDIFTQTTLRGDIVDGLNYRNALFGIKNKIQKDYVMFEPDYNSDDTLSILTYTVNE